VQCTVNGKGSIVQRAIAVNDRAFVVDADQVLDLHDLEAHAERVHPEAIVMFWVTNRDVACCTLGQP